MGLHGRWGARPWGRQGRRVCVCLTRKLLAAFLRRAWRPAPARCPRPRPPPRGRGAARSLRPSPRRSRRASCASARHSWRSATTSDACCSDDERYEESLLSSQLEAFGEADLNEEQQQRVVRVVLVLVCSRASHRQRLFILFLCPFLLFSRIFYPKILKSEKKGDTRYLFLFPRHSL